ncbi:hypothetical protein Tco_0817723 [Tanacetum coccineum]
MNIFSDQLKDLRRSERRPKKEVVVEQDNDDKSMDVNDEPSDDDFVDMGRNSSYASGLRRSGRNKDKEVYYSGHAKTMASGSKGKGEKQGRKRSRETCMSKAEKKADSDKPAGLKPNQKACLEEIGFGGMVEFKFDGILSKLGLYVVDNFDDNKMEIKLSKGSIVLTKDMIGEMLGLKNEGLDILEGNPNRDDEMVRNWKQQYGDGKEIKPTNVKMRMRKSAEADLNFKLNFIVLFTSIMGNIRQKGVCDTAILDYITPNMNPSNISWCDYVWRALNTCKKGWKKGKKDSYFRGPLTVLTMCYVDGTKCNDNIVCHRRPPTKVWAAELLSEREAEELNCGGFRHGELEEDFVDEEGDPIPNNIECPGNVNLIGLDDKYINSLKCTSGGNNSGTNETMPGIQEKEKDVQGEAGCINMNRVEALYNVGIRAQRNEEVEVRISDIGVNEQTPGSGKHLMGITKNSVADEVELSIEKSKIMEMDDRPSFSFGVTQDLDVVPVTNNENKVLTPMPISAYTPKGEASDVFMFHGRRVTSKLNIMRSPFYNRVADADAVLSSEESKVTKYLFLTVHESESGRRPEKEVVVEPDNDDKYIDNNDELSDDDFVDMGRNTSYASGKGKKEGRKRSWETTMSEVEKKAASNKPAGLKPNQKACLEEIEFGGMVDFKVNGIPSKLGLYVVDNFDDNKMEIKLSKGSIILTKDMIGEMLGLKNEGLDILEGNPNRDDEMMRNWKQQYGDAKEIKPIDVKMRMRKSEEADLNFKLNFIVLFTSIMGNIRQKGVCDTSILDYITPNTNLSNINWCEYVWRALKTCKKGWKKGKKDSYFRGPLTVLTMCYVDGTKCNDNIVCRRRPPTKVWTTENLSEREAKELNCGGFGPEELEEDFVDEEGDPIPNNIKGYIWMLNNYVKNITKEQKGFEKMLTAAKHMFPGNVNLIGFADKYINSLKCTSGGNNSGTNATMHQTQEKEKDVQGEAGCPNMNRVEVLNDVGFLAQRNEEVEVGVSDIGVNERTPGSGKDLKGLTTNSFVDVVVDTTSLSGFSVIPATNNEKKVLTPMPISAYTPKGEASDVFMFHGRRVASKSNIMRSPFYDRVVDVDVAFSSEESKVTKYLFMTNHESEWAVVHNDMEEYRSNDLPFRLFLPTFVLDKDSFSELSNDDGRFNRVVRHVEPVTRTSSELKKLKKIDLYGPVIVFNQKKKDKIVKKANLRKELRLGTI